MPYFVRKVSRAKWPDNKIPINSVQADAISDLKTQKNSLSLWVIDSIDKPENAILALATGSLIRKIENIKIVVISKQQFDDAGLTLDDKEKGDTAIQSLVDKHYNIVGLNYESLGTVSSVIMDSIAYKQEKTFLASKIREMLKNEYINGKIDIDHLHEDLREIIKSL